MLARCKFVRVSPWRCLYLCATSACFAVVMTCRAETETAAAPAPQDHYLGKNADDWAAVIHAPDNPAQLKTALEALLELGSAPAGIVPDLMTLVRGGAEPETTRLAILALGVSNPETQDVEPALLGILNNI